MSDESRGGHTIRPFRPEDAEWIARACQDEDIQRWTMVPSSYGLSDAVAFLEGQEMTELHWAIIDPDGEPVGSIGVRDLDTPTPEIGYWVAPWGRRRGAAREAIALAVANFARLSPGERLQALIASTNVASQRAITSAGFELVGDAGRECPDGECEVAAFLYEITV